MTQQILRIGRNAWRHGQGFAGLLNPRDRLNPCRSMQREAREL
ncbi:hypothetical protein PSE10B_44380 [Pseudomonas amygdali pv. eriobotryae]|uniref:Uncharacterized protein n=3 Tax=Pseudomonas syringae group TaxID=136849 RepID=A0A0N8RRQ6_PSEA0|nr:Uncharacterized protein ALO50_00553 [Pseudomonas syringae pv. cerasicola]KPX54655.1 Uncharacterized protein ALO53_03500 [Pseudomonas amygdali pv. photiniae]KPX78364.1 Uncharacterized protein ALO64_02700 [Pseudomonas meliae]KPY62866.1 hypothetical protein ALO93_101055 [Pseudomonas amygdali pv. sesami]RMU97334.1 hypothetical protein ALP18_04340 [Pseudomonas amygdali pv. myricae]GFZ67916.1 hypothetical protein PSE10B_44380 [Pseudomonas amygdali pv. eriobotryae]